MHSSNPRRFDTASNSGAPPNKRPKSEGGQGGYPFLDQFLERNDSKLPPSHVILISIMNVKYPINVEVVYKVCTMAGKVRKIICFERNNIMQAMVEFETLESADKARTALHGCDIYDNCCTMKVEYSKSTSLTLKQDNGPMSWDFTDGSESVDKRPVILNRPGMMGGDMMGSQGGMNRNSGLGSMFVNNMGMSAGSNINPVNPMLGGGGNPASNLMNLVPNLLASATAGGPQMGGGGGRGSSGMPPGSGHGHHDMARSMDRDYDYDRTCVLMVYGLESDRWDPQMVFNLICQYGNVNKIFFMKNKEGTAMVEMGDPDAAEYVVKYIGEINVLGSKVRFNLSKKHRRLTVTPLDFELQNGSSSIKDFAHDKHMNRFVREDLARKNRLLKPTKVLHFYNVLRVPDEELLTCFQERGAPEPCNIKWVDPKEGSKVTGSSGLIYFDSLEDCTDALVLMNHCRVGERNMKLGYSPAKY